MAAGSIQPDDLDNTPASSMPPIQGAPPPLAQSSPSQPAAPGQGAPALAQAPQGRSIEQGTGKGEIQTPPVRD